MCSSGQLCSGNGRPPSSYASDNANNSGSQYALCALGVGLVALGIVMIVWSVVPSNVPGNNSSGGGGGGGGSGGSGSKPGPGNASTRGNTSSVAFVLAGVGVAMLLLSICLGVRSKRRQQRAAQAADARLSARATEGQEGETEESAARYDVPTYEEAVGSGQYPAPPSLLPCSSSASQLPSYEDLVDGVQHEDEDEDEAPASGAGPQPAPAAAAAPTPPQLQPAPAAAAAPPNRQNGLGRKLRPPKVRRIKSEKLHLKDISNAPPAGPPSIEPLTPPPQYDDQLPRL